VDETRQQNGNQWVMTNWDSYRGGLELMIYNAFRFQGSRGIPAEQSALVAQMINQFVILRMQVAMRLLISAGDYIAAQTVMVRLLATGGLTEAETEHTRSSLAVRAGVQSFLQAFDATTSLNRIGLCNVSNAEVFKRFVRNARPNLEIVDLDEGAADTPDKHRMLVLAGGNDARNRLIELGFHPGLVKGEAETIWLFSS
jgi:hypothetical protein